MQRELEESRKAAEEEEAREAERAGKPSHFHYFPHTLHAHPVLPHASPDFVFSI